MNLVTNNSPNCKTALHDLDSKAAKSEFFVQRIFERCVRWIIKSPFHRKSSGAGLTIKFPIG
jgi:hypothetical protein